MVSAAALTYKIKREAEEQLAAVHRLQAEIRTEEETIDLLKADWSLLTQPSRLQKLTGLYASQLDLQPTDAHQIGSLDDLPAKAVDGQDPLQAIISSNGKDQPKGGRVASGGKDPTVTGSTKR
jgi:hypothetical protein